MTNPPQTLDRKIYFANFSPVGDYSTIPRENRIYVTEGIIKHSPSRLHQIFQHAFSLATEDDILVLTGSQLVSAAAYYEWFSKFPNGRMYAWNKYLRTFEILNVNLPLEGE